jgi:hypothetical protein
MGKHRWEDESNDDQEGQGNDRESVHGGDLSWVRRGVPWEERIGLAMARDYKWIMVQRVQRVGATRVAILGTWISKFSNRFLNRSMVDPPRGSGSDMGHGWFM